MSGTALHPLSGGGRLWVSIVCLTLDVEFRLGLRRARVILGHARVGALVLDVDLLDDESLQTFDVLDDDLLRFLHNLLLEMNGVEGRGRGLTFSWNHFTVGAGSPTTLHSKTTFSEVFAFLSAS